MNGIPGNLGRGLRRRIARRGVHPRATPIGLAVRARNMLVGIDRYPDPWAYFGPGGLEAAAAVCAEANRDLPGFVRPPEVIEAAGVERRPSIVRRDGVRVERWSLDSPRPSGLPNNDRVVFRLYHPPGGRSDGRVVLFHHPFYQRRWPIWEWFLADLVTRVPVAIVAAPHHFERCEPGRFPGEQYVNPNPARLFESVRQWCWDHQAVVSALERSAGLGLAAEIGYSLGAFQMLLLGSAGRIRAPIVTIASTNHFAHGLIRGIMGTGLLKGMREVGITPRRLASMTSSLRLERHVAGLRGVPILYLRGRNDQVDPPPSLDLLQQALRPTRAVVLDGGHATLLRQRSAIHRELRDFLSTSAGLDV